MKNKYEKVDTIRVSQKLVGHVKKAVAAALSYEEASNGKRKLGITGEVGEILICHQLNLRLMVDPRSVGYDAIDNEGKHIEIKTRRSETLDVPKETGRLSRFSEHKFDYALLGLLNKNYELTEVWSAKYDRLAPIIRKARQRNPNIASFKRVADPCPVWKKRI